MHKQAEPLSTLHSALQHILSAVVITEPVNDTVESLTKGYFNLGAATLSFLQRLSFVQRTTTTGLVL